MLYFRYSSNKTSLISLRLWLLLFAVALPLRKASVSFKYKLCRPSTRNALALPHPLATDKIDERLADAHLELAGYLANAKSKSGEATLVKRHFMLSVVRF